MLLPALAKAREKAREVSCKNNLKTLNMAQCMYPQDNESFLFGYQFRLPDKSSRIIWCNWLYYSKYISGGGQKKFLYKNSPTNGNYLPYMTCPSDSPERVSWSNIPCLDSFGYNRCICSETNASVPPKTTFLKHQAEVKKPTEIVTFADNWKYYQSIDKVVSSDGVTALLGYSVASIRTYGAHGTSRNAGFIDGHVESQKSIKVYSKSGAEDIWDAASDSELETR